MKNTRFEYEVVTEKEVDGKTENKRVSFGSLFALNLEKAILAINREHGKAILVLEEEGKKVEILCRPFCSK